MQCHFVVGCQVKNTQITLKKVNIVYFKLKCKELSSRKCRGGGGGGSILVALT